MLSKSNTTQTETSYNYCGALSVPLTGTGTTTTFVTPGTFITSNIHNMQHKVAIFKLTRNDDGQITDSQFIKELWVKTKNNSSVEFEVARDKDLEKYNAEELSIKIITSFNF